MVYVHGEEHASDWVRKKYGHTCIRHLFFYYYTFNRTTVASGEEEEETEEEGDSNLDFDGQGVDEDDNM